MNTILDFTDINKMTRIIQEKFPSSFVLYSLNNEEIQKFNSYEINTIEIFNNKTWLDILKNYNYLDCNQLIDGTYPSLYPPSTIFCDIPYDHFIKKFIFNFTGLFYIGALIETNNNQENGNYCFTICKFMDLGSLYYNEDGDRFTELIDLYNDEQLLIISSLMIYLENFVDISFIGKKYWHFIHNNL